MKNFTWYDKDRKECTACGCLMPDDEVVQAIHDKEPHHKFRMVVQHIDPIPPFTSTPMSEMGISNPPVYTDQDFKRMETESKESSEVTKLFSPIFKDLLTLMREIDELDRKNKKLKEML
jgi:hypothetical protein